MCVGASAAARHKMVFTTKGEKRGGKTHPFAGPSVKKRIRWGKRGGGVLYIT